MPENVLYTYAALLVASVVGHALRQSTLVALSALTCAVLFAGDEIAPVAIAFSWLPVLLSTWAKVLRSGD